jgi:hypothetical protein
VKGFHVKPSEKLRKTLVLAGLTWYFKPLAATVFRALLYQIRNRLCATAIKGPRAAHGNRQRR